MVSGRRRGKRRDLHRDRVNQQPGAGPPAERRASGTHSLPKSTVIAGNPEASLRPGSRMTATIRDLATACHAEGRGFESHQPLEEELSANAELWTLDGRLARNASRAGFRLRLLASG